MKQRVEVLDREMYSEAEAARLLGCTKERFPTGSTVEPVAARLTNPSSARRRGRSELSPGRSLSKRLYYGSTAERLVFP